MTVIDRRRTVPPGRSSVERDGLLDSVQLAAIMHGILDGKPHEMGEGLAYRINRREMARLFGKFPASSEFAELTQHMRGKTVVCWGAGDVGKGTATLARAMGANVVFIDIKDETLEARRREFGANGVAYVNSTQVGAEATIDDVLSSPETAGVALGALVKGDRAPILLTRERLASINERRRAAGAEALVVADAQIDQGGGVEGVHSTNHNQPFMAIKGSPVYSVPNVPGSRYTAGYASQRLEEATLEDTVRLIEARARGIRAFDADPLIKTALNTWGGRVTDEKVAGHFHRDYSTPDEALAAVRHNPQTGKVVLGVAAEIKDFENRVALTDRGVGEVLRRARELGIDLEVWVESNAGVGSGIGDDAYKAAGAMIKSRQEVLENADVLKGVKEPMGDELQQVKEGAWAYTYFHYTGMKDSRMLDWAVGRRIASFAYETRLDENGELPQLKCMSDVDGRSNALIIAAATNPGIIEIGAARRLMEEYMRRMRAGEQAERLIEERGRRGH